MTELPAIICDTREQRALDFGPGVPVAVRKLDAGDYSLVGFQDCIAVERKSLQDLVASLGRERARFERALGRLRQRRWHCVVVEGDWHQITGKCYRGTVRPTALIGSVAAIVADGTPVLMASSPSDTAVLTLRLLRKFYSRALRAREAA